MEKVKTGTLEELFFELVQKFANGLLWDEFHFYPLLEKLRKEEASFFKDADNRYNATYIIEALLWKSNHSTETLILEPVLECMQAMHVNFKHFNPTNKKLDEVRFSQVISVVDGFLTNNPLQKNPPKSEDSLLEINLLFGTWLRMLLKESYVPKKITTNLKSLNWEDIVKSLEKEFDEALLKQGFYPNEFLLHNALSRVSVCLLQGEYFYELKYLLDYIKKTMEGNLKGELIVI